MRPKTVHPWVGVEHTGSMARQRKCKTVRYTLGKTLASDVQFLWKCGPIPHKLFCCNDLCFSFKAVHFIILFCAHIFNMLKQWANILRTTYSHYQRTPATQTVTNLLFQPTFLPLSAHHGDVLLLSALPTLQPCH